MYIHPVFSSVPPQARETLLKALELRSFRRNEVVLRAGSDVTALYCVGSGLLRVVLPGPGDSLVTTNFMRQDEIHISAALGQAHSISDLSLLAALPSTVYMLPLSALNKLCDSHPAVCVALLNTQLARMASLRQQMRRLATLSAEHVVGQALQELTHIAPEGEHAFDKRISQAVIASYTGLSRTMVNKIINEMEDRGELKRQGEAIQLQDGLRFHTDVGMPLCRTEEAAQAADARCSCP
jgi:CRP-like cAMP-binding protein